MIDEGWRTLIDITVIVTGRLIFVACKEAGEIVGKRLAPSMAGSARPSIG